MNKETYGKAFKEVYMILKSLGEDVLNKIPQNILNLIEENMDKNYFFMLDENIALEDQNFLNETLGIISLLYRDYVCPEEEKINMQEDDAKNLIKFQNEIENELREKYNPDCLFKNKDLYTKQPAIGENTKSTEIVECKEKNFFKKIFNKLKNLLIKERNFI